MRTAIFALDQRPPPPEPWVNGSNRGSGFPQEAPSMPMPRAAAASSKQTARNGNGVPVASKFSVRLKSQADGQKHLPDSKHTNGSQRT